MCGEKPKMPRRPWKTQGSPPHVRGKVACEVQTVCNNGITPACAGKRAGDESALATPGDHPRMCGEKTKKIP